MAARFAVPVVPMRASIVRRRVVIEAAPPLEPAAFADAPALNCALFAVLARWVRERPEQWVGWEYLTPAE
jgi:lauroyl/myristoyl acyltransferase